MSILGSSCLNSQCPFPKPAPKSLPYLCHSRSILSVVQVPNFRVKLISRSRMITNSLVHSVAFTPKAGPKTLLLPYLLSPLTASIFISCLDYYNSLSPILILVARRSFKNGSQVMPFLSSKPSTDSLGYSQVKPTSLRRLTQPLHYKDQPFPFIIF